MADYQLTASSSAIVRLSDQAIIPADPANMDYASYLAWLANGNAPDPYIPPPPPVPTITKAQALLYLLSIGKTESDVKASIATISDLNARAVAEIEWNYRQPFHHNHPLFAALGPAVGITDMETAFRIAATL